MMTSAHGPGTFRNVIARSSSPSWFGQQGTFSTTHTGLHTTSGTRTGEGLNGGPTPALNSCGGKSGPRLPTSPGSIM